MCRRARRISSRENASTFCSAKQHLARCRLDQPEGCSVRSSSFRCPDSPTRPNVSPSSTVKLTSLTARTTLGFVEKALRSGRTASPGGGLRRGRGIGTCSRIVEVASRALVRPDVVGRRRRGRAELEAVRSSAARTRSPAGGWPGSARCLRSRAGAVPARLPESTRAAPACRDASGARRALRIGPSSTMRPAYITATRSACPATTPRSCVISSSARWNFCFISCSRSRISA